MEKPFAGQWLYDDEDLAPVNMLWETFMCPCIIYGRSKKSYDDAVDREFEYDSPSDGHVRFKVSEKGIVDTHGEYWSRPLENPTISLPCLKFAACLPFYGTFIWDLRTKVRDLYNIEGSRSEDIISGCCYPYDSLIQIEHELMNHGHHRRRSCCGSHSKATTCDTEPDASLPCIPEDSSECTSPTSSASSRSKSRERSIAQDPVAPTDATLDHSHDLSKDPRGQYRTNAPHRLKDDTSAPVYPPSIHQLRTDTKAPASPPAVHRHDMFQDASETHEIQPNHDIGFDRVETHRASPDHQLRQDEKTPGAFPSAAHHLHHDTVVRTKAPRQHMLEEDEQGPSRSGNGGPHHLDEDK
ncbi:integral membrane protein [Fusarium sp. NRRL 52700]|nr:integral membrane protein [Fusarium sp. NRRL 52700]